MTLKIGGIIDPTDGKITVNVRDGGFDVIVKYVIGKKPVEHTEEVDDIKIEHDKDGVVFTTPVKTTRTHTEWVDDFATSSIFIDPMRVADKPDICVGYVSESVGIQLVWDSERMHTRDAASSVSDRKGIGDINASIFMVAFDATGAYFAACLPLKEIPTGAEFISAKMNYAPRVWLSSQSQEVGKIVAKSKAKRDILGKINTMDSIYALEMQSDLLLYALAELIEQVQPDKTKQPNWLDRVKSDMHNGASFQYAVVENALNRIMAVKMKVRALQAQYYAKLTEIEANNG